jgi:hypothetical protein
MLVLQAYGLRDWVLRAGWPLTLPRLPEIGLYAC